MREGRGDCLKYLNRGRNRTVRRGHKDFKRGGQAGSRDGCLKKGGWNPLMNYLLSFDLLDLAQNDNIPCNPLSKKGVLQNKKENS